MPEDDRGFLYENNTAYFMWRNACEKAGFNQKQAYNGTLERFVVHPHVLRKFFQLKWEV